MKKFLLFIFAIFILSGVAFARTSEVISNQYLIEAQKKIDKIGFNLLNSNGIDKRMVFGFNLKRVVNAGTYSADRQIVMYRGIYERLNSDDEIAAVLAHEISHGVDSYDGILRGFFYKWSHFFAPKKYEYKADKRAVDYMVHAGYNPVAMIVMQSKLFSQRRYDWYSTHPLTSRRMMTVYEYIYNKYPEYLVKNKYKDDIFYQNFLLTSQDNRLKFQQKVEKKSKKPVKYM
ncbi:M48 family metallopeptidase [bacterium]|nr:M48 family metallopeptidase [bacterium]